MLTVLITVGVTVGAVALLHGRILTLNAEPTKNDEDDSDADPTTPSTFLLSERIVSITTTGFIFLLAFTLGNLWSNHRTAEQAIQTEVAELARAAGAAQFLPPAHRDPILAAVDAYFTSVREVQWTSMEAGDAMGALRAQSKASGELVGVAAAAAMEGAETSSAWSSLSTAIDDALASSTVRISQIPSPRTTSVLLLVCGLGLVNLAMVAAFYPAPLRRNLFLMGVMAAITATLVFVVVEASNPYLGSGALKPTMYTFPHGFD
jgi:hypothetical protein